MIKRHNQVVPDHQVRTVEGCHIQVVHRCLAKTLVQGKFQIEDIIDKGGFGEILSVQDVTQEEQSALVMKVVTSTSDFFKEVSAMKRIHRRASHYQKCWNQKDCPVPEVVAWGLLFKHRSASASEFSLEEYQKQLDRGLLVDDLKKIGTINSYIIMPRYSQNLSTFFHKKHHQLSVASVVDIGCRVLEQLKAVHKAGYVYNDLKPANIMLKYDTDLEQDNSEGSCLQEASLHLVDFGFCTKYKNRKTGELFLRENVKVFRGTPSFASADQLDYFSTSRKDDLISLCYVLLYLLRKGSFLGGNTREQVSKMDEKSRIKWYLDLKRQLTPEQLCYGRAAALLPFVKAVYRTDFFDKPDHDHLATILKRQQEVPRTVPSSPTSQTLANFSGSKDRSTVFLPQFPDTPMLGISDTHCPAKELQQLQQLTSSPGRKPSPSKNIRAVALSSQELGPRSRTPSNASCGLRLFDGLFSHLKLMKKKV